MKRLLLAALFLWPAAFILPVQAVDFGEGYLMDVQGSVEVKKRGGRNWIAAYNEMRINPGDQLATGVNGRTTLVLKGSRTEIHPLTQFVVGRCVEGEKQNYTELFLQVGKVAAEVSKRTLEANKFNIVTPTTVAGVRGTRMEVSYLPALGTQTKITDGRGYVSPVTISKLPPAVLPLLNLAEPPKKEKEKKEETTEEEKSEAKQDEGKTDEAEGAEKTEPATPTEEGQPAVMTEEGQPGMTTEEGEEATAELGTGDLFSDQALTGEAVTTDAAVELFNEFLEQTDKMIDPDVAFADLQPVLFDEKTFDYVIQVDNGQQTLISDPDDPAAIMTPIEAEVQSSQTVIAPEGLSAVEVEVTAASTESVDAPQSIQVTEEQSTFMEATENAAKSSTSQGGIPPSSTLVPPALPDRTGKSNLTN